MCTPDASCFSSFHLDPPACQASGLTYNFPPIVAPPMPDGTKNTGLIWVYATTIFLSALLLFQVQPIISRFILPWFGGAPAVWTAAMLFFQTTLLAGYAYAHLTERYLPPRLRAAIHVTLLAAAALSLPFVPRDRWKPADGSYPVARILLLLAVSVGLPYFVLSTTGPLVQAWFSRRFPGRSPYRLYSLSNVGSLLALLTYPFLIEPRLTLGRQAAMWQAGFWVFAALCAWGAIRMCLQRPEEGRLSQREKEKASGKRPANCRAAQEQAAALAAPLDEPPLWQPQVAVGPACPRWRRSAFSPRRIMCARIFRLFRFYTSCRSGCICCRS